MQGPLFVSSFPIIFSWLTPAHPSSFSLILIFLGKSSWSDRSNPPILLLIKKKYVSFIAFIVF